MTDDNEFKCEFLEIPEYRIFPVTKDTVFKKGRYHGSVFTVPGYGTSTWVIAGYIKVDWKQLQKQGLSNQEILDRCITYLNAPTVMASGKVRKNAKNKYDMTFGSCIHHKFIEADNQPVIECYLTTNKHNSKHFWSEGILMSGGIAARGGKKKLEQNEDVLDDIVDPTVEVIESLDEDKMPKKKGKIPKASNKLIKKEKKPSGRVCGRCGQPGHNARTCGKK